MVAEEAAPQPIHHNLKQALEMLAKKPPSFTVLINEVAWFLNTFVGIPQDTERLCSLRTTGPGVCGSCRHAGNSATSS